ncbi:MAG: 2-C-methyl-D-erythritol 4-phosphate cytidylyltransferase [Muribaculaceae bacterium]|jgi:2-C-methyl-D-erythritol 4-phosphate cytidylyltransferase|nr:2-C-methyl-D-erythritol 4-phosphate cytidylyltransferase [Muribaculaceae bacterium]
MKRYAIIVAGGSGTRFGAAMPKQFLPLLGTPILMHTVSRFAQPDLCDHIVVVLPDADIQRWHDLCREHGFTASHHVVAGGDTRFQSVKNGLNALEIAPGDVVAVHDGVRPLIRPADIEAAFTAAAQHGSAIPMAVFPHSDSLRQQLPDGTTRPIDRQSLRVVLTPQVFNATLLREAYARPFDPRFTDDATVFEAAGHTIHPIEGDLENIKITRPDDLVRAERILAERLGQNTPQP